VGRRRAKEVARPVVGTGRHINAPPRFRRRRSPLWWAPGEAAPAAPRQRSGFGSADASSSTPRRTDIVGAAVFDGDSVKDCQTVVLEGAVIASVGLAPPPEDVEVVDADGAVLLPGLIDCHVHLRDIDTLRALAQWGVTTALDMATWPAELLASLRDQRGLTDVRSPGLPAIGPGGPHATLMKLPSQAVVTAPDQASAFVAQRVAEGADYIKIVLEAPG
jgi:hypothetical protein